MALELVFFVMNVGFPVLKVTVLTQKTVNLLPFIQGRRDYSRKVVILVTDGQSNVQTHLTIPNAKALKDSGVKIYVVVFGAYIPGIDEMVKVASYPPNQYMFRVKTLGKFHDIIKLILQKVNPQKWKIAAGQYDPPCSYGN